MGSTTSKLSTLHLKIESLEGAVDEMGQTFALKGSNFNLEGLNNLKENQIESSCSSPRLSTCTHRPASQYRPQSNLSSTRVKLLKDKLSSRTALISSTKDGLDLLHDPTIKLRKKVKEKEDLISALTSSVYSKEENYENVAVDWRMINDYLCSGDVESAYKEVLLSGDEVNLLDLMNRTGPILESLSPEVATKVLGILSRKFINCSFVHSMIPWLQQVLDLSRFRGPNQPFLSKNAQMEFLCAVKGMADAEYIDHKDRMSIAQFAVKLNKLWGEAESRKIPLPRGPSETMKMGKNAKV
ncbi:TORTIFOLIA1-like protein 2 [Phalaenopsis equestris]|uniref:TORTIFOLIA1-like protein 2 n=1 Tax=Phalaenopsis equestris TaxID=78828 RepID=UPI0009E35A67|nr:TORTIFOLIA1-like protein 2 [Phalaenopsis equestris]